MFKNKHRAILSTIKQYNDLKANSGPHFLIGKKINIIAAPNTAIMDVLIGFLYDALPFINIVGLLAVLFKLYLFMRMRTKTVQHLILSFFLIHPRHEIEISNNPAKRKLMWMNNALNFLLYVIVLFNLFFYLVIRK